MVKAWPSTVLTPVEGDRRPAVADGGAVQVRSGSKRHPKSKPGSAGPQRGLLGAISADEVATIIHRACTSKERFGAPGPARRTARRLSAATGDRVRAYRCPFGDGTRARAHWHVGH